MNTDPTTPVRDLLSALHVAHEAAREAMLAEEEYTPTCAALNDLRKRLLADMSAVSALVHAEPAKEAA